MYVKPFHPLAVACLVAFSVAGCKSAGPKAEKGGAHTEHAHDQAHEHGHSHKPGESHEHAHAKDPSAKPAAQAAAPAEAPPPSGDIPAPADVAAPPADAKKTESGLAYKVLTQGSGPEHPRKSDTVKVHYSGWTTDGKMFDSSRKRGQPTSFRLDQVIRGWTEGVQLMKVGEKTRFWIPVELAYNNQPGMPAGMLVFDIELLEVTKGPEPPKVPEDVAAAPSNAKKTKSGLAYRVLKKGAGKVHPKADTRVQVHYSGWTTDGAMFDSSVTRGRPTSFALNRVIEGWTEGVQLMVEGEKTRFWIPQDLAYKGRPGPPAGMLVFDIELLKIMN